MSKKLNENLQKNWYSHEKRDPFEHLLGLAGDEAAEGLTEEGSQ